jgi:hypothetical protein
MTKKRGAHISVRKIGTVQGDTLAGKILEAVKNREADGVLATDDGTNLDWFSTQRLKGHHDGG